MLYMNKLPEYLKKILDGLLQRFSKRTEEICDFASEFVRIGKEFITGDHPVHITNKAMNDCLKLHG